MQVKDLSHFRIVGVECSSGDGSLRLVGHFTHLRSVHGQRGWLLRFPNFPVIGDLSALPTRAEDTVIFETPESELVHTVTPGGSFPWLDDRWQAYHVPMILAPASSWQRTTFVATPAQYFVLNGVTGWQPLGQALPDGAVATSVREGAWDHEHCEICDHRIGSNGDVDGYVNSDNRWICMRCFDRYASRNDISFALEA